MQVVTADLVKDKKVLLRLDIDVPLGKTTDYRLPTTAEDGSQKTEDLVVLDDFRLIAGMPTLELCLKHAENVIILGHIGRPDGKVVEELSVALIYDWLVDHGFKDEFESGKLRLLENLRFEKGEEEADIDYAKELVALGDFFVNEAFASHHKSASTTILPTLLPHAAGLQFAKEVENLTKVRENPKKPLVVIIGGVKVEDKLPAVQVLAKIADYVLVGGKIASELARGPAGSQPHPTSSLTLRAIDGAPRLPSPLAENILLAELNEGGTDITAETVEKWATIIVAAKMIVWNGPVGKIEGLGSRVKGLDGEELGSVKGTYEIAQMIIKSGAEIVVGGGDTVGFLGEVGLIDNFEKKGFVSTGGGAMLKFLETGTLPTIEALK